MGSIYRPAVALAAEQDNRGSLSIFVIFYPDYYPDPCQLWPQLTLRPMPEGLPWLRGALAQLDSPWVFLVECWWGKEFSPRLVGRKLNHDSSFFSMISWYTATSLSTRKSTTPNTSY